MALDKGDQPNLAKYILNLKLPKWKLRDLDWLELTVITVAIHGREIS